MIYLTVLTASSTLWTCLMRFTYELALWPAVWPQVKRRYGLPVQKILRATLRREITLVKRNAFIYGFRCACHILSMHMLGCFPCSCQWAAGCLSRVSQQFVLCYFLQHGTTCIARTASLT